MENKQSKEKKMEPEVQKKPVKFNQPAMKFNGNKKIPEPKELKKK